jgi:hypothetical protein
MRQTMHDGSVIEKSRMRQGWVAMALRSTAQACATLESTVWCGWT